MTEKSAEDFIPGLDELDEPPKSVVNLNINDTRIADVKAQLAGVDATKDFKSAKAAAKTCQQMRATLTDAHKQQKAESLAFGRTLDAEKNRLLSLIAEIEDPIRAQIEEIETAEKRKEEERVEAIEVRIQDIRSYGINLDGATLAELETEQESLTAIEIDDSFEEFREQAAGAKAEAESRLRIAIGHAQTREEKAARLEQQRKEQEEQQAALDAQQAKLDAQAAEQKAESDAMEAEHNRKFVEEADIKRQLEEQEATERKAELAKQQKEIDRQNREREERERVEKEAAEKEAAAARAAELAPDKEKLDKLAGSLEQLLLPEVQSQQAEDVLTYVRSELKAIAVNVKHYAGEME